MNHEDELMLRQAAKALGYTILGTVVDRNGNVESLRIDKEGMPNDPVMWNPLVRSDQAVSLQARFDITVRFTEMTVTAASKTAIRTVFAVKGDTPEERVARCAAIRRAITSCAAWEAP